jgi:hypothetical protein
MKSRSIASWLLPVTASVVVVAFVAVLTQHSSRAAQDPNSYTPAMLPDGQPDIQGVYVSPWRVPLERWTEAEREEWGEKMVAVRGPNPGAYGLEWTESNLRQDNPTEGMVAVVDPADGQVPWQPWALAKKTYIRNNPYERQSFLDTRVRCLPAGTPRGTFSSSYNGWQVLQPPGHVVILYEHNHLHRVIPVDDSPHPGPDIQLWMGDSRAHWEGNTLVVDVRNLTDKTWVIGELGGEGMSAGSFHSPAMHVVERFTIVDADTIDYEATVEDPNVFTKPWTIAYRVWKRAPEDYVLFEYACHEGNRSMDLTALISGTSE